MVRVCPHSDAICPNGMACAFSCATDEYDGTKRPTADKASAPADGLVERWGSGHPAIILDDVFREAVRREEVAGRKDPERKAALAVMRAQAADLAKAAATITRLQAERDEARGLAERLAGLIRECRLADAHGARTGDERRWDHAFDALCRAEPEARAFLTRTEPRHG